jgi:hypothetical protein
MRKHLKPFATGLLICPVRAGLGTPAADFRMTLCPGQNRKNGPFFSKIIEPARAG